MQTSSLSSFLIKNIKVAFLLGIAILIMGIFAIMVIPKESAPTIEFGVVNITTVYPGVSATDVDALVTQKIESKISSITSIKKYTSSSQSGISNITAEFRPGVNMVKAVSDIRSKVDEAKNELPSDIESDPNITEIDSSLQPFLQVILYGDYPAYQLTTVAEKLKTQLEGLSGVASVGLSGDRETEIQVRINQKKLEALGLLIPQVQSAIRSAHSDVPIGDLEIENLEYTLRFQGKLKSVEDVKDVAITNISGQNSLNPKIIFLKDIADVFEIGRDDSFGISRYGEPGIQTQSAITLSVSRTGGQDIFAADESVRQIVDKFSEKNFLPGMQYTYASEGVTRMEDDFSNLFQNAGTSVALVLLLIFFFIGIREGLIASMVIPLAFLSTIAVLFFLGKSLNFMTNFSMILALGILVDTAIVMVEGVHHYVKKGYSTKEAAQKSFDEFSAPLVSGMATTVVVFLPLFFLPDIMGKYLSYIPITVTIVLLSALFISLYLITAYSGVFMKTVTSPLLEGVEGCGSRSVTPSKSPLKGENKKQSFFSSLRQKIDQKFSALISWYSNFLLKILPYPAKKWSIFAVIIFLFIGSFMIPVKFEMFPSADGGFLSIDFEKQVGINKEVTLQEAMILEEFILSVPEVQKIKTSISGNSASIYIELLTIDERKEKNMRTAKELEAVLHTEFKKISNEAVQIQGEAKGPPSSSPVGFRVIMSDIEYLENAKQVTEDLTNLIAKESGTQGARNTISQIPGEFRFDIDREKALKLGIAPESIASMVRTALYGSSVATITRAKQDINIRVQLSDKDINSLEDIKNFKISSNIPLSSVVTISKESALSEVSRYDGKLMFKVSSFLTKEGNASEITASIVQKIADKKISVLEGVSIEDASENADNAALMNSLMGSGIMAILMIFIILVIQFNSFSQPLLILQTILFAQIGVSIGLFVTDTPRSLAFVLGVISLAGIVVNDAIIMVDKMNRNIKSGEFDDHFEAIASAGSSRFIPVVLTTLTTSAGILPLIFVDAFWAGLSYTIFFGLMIATFLTLFMIPVGYTLFWKGKKK